MIEAIFPAATFSYPLLRRERIEVRGKEGAGID